MAHHLAHRSAYQRLTDRLNRFPQGAPPSESLFAILKLLFSEREAALVSALPIRPVRAEKTCARAASTATLRSLFPPRAMVRVGDAVRLVRPSPGRGVPR